MGRWIDSQIFEVILMGVVIEWLALFFFSLSCTLTDSLSQALASSVSLFLSLLLCNNLFVSLLSLAVHGNESKGVRVNMSKLTACWYVVFQI